MTGSFANITWNLVQDHEIDFYLIRIFASGSDVPLHSSFERDAQEDAVLHTTSELVVNVSTRNRCNQMSPAATMSFKGKSRDSSAVFTFSFHISCRSGLT